MTPDDFLMDAADRLAALREQQEDLLKAFRERAGLIFPKTYNG